MTPTVVFDTFGIVSSETGNVVPTAYVLALVVMVFTAISYGRMTRIFPSAGSSYTYTSATISPNVGFLIGWAAPARLPAVALVNALIIRSYMYAFFPDVPSWLWVVVHVAAITAMCLFSMTNTSRVNMLLVAFEVVLIGVFLVLAAKSLIDGMGNGTIFSTRPAWHDGVHLNLVITGATIVAFSFIGFDAITMYTEGGQGRPTVPRAIVLALLIGGAIFFTAAWFTQSLFPDISDFSEESLENSAAADRVHGRRAPVQDPATSAAFRRHGRLQPGIARVGVPTALRDGTQRSGADRPVLRLSAPEFSDPSSRDPVRGSRLAAGDPFNLDFVASLINFGALIAFTFVNLTVIVYFAYRRREINGPVRSSPTSCCR